MVTRKSKTLGTNPLDALSRDTVSRVTESARRSTKAKNIKKVVPPVAKPAAKKATARRALDTSNKSVVTPQVPSERALSKPDKTPIGQTLSDTGKHPSMLTPLVAPKADEQSVEALFEEVLGSKSSSSAEPAYIAQENQLIDPEAVALIKTWSQWSSVGAVAPAPLLGYAIVFGIQVQMIRAMCKHYKVEYQHKKVILIASGLVGGTINTGLAQIVNATLVKSIPVFGPVVSYVAEAALSYGVTYALGYSFAKHFEAKGTLSTFNADGMKEYFAQQVTNGKALFKNKSAVAV